MNMDAVYFQPRTLGEALDILQREDGICVLAGGTDIMVERRAGRLDFTKVLDIGRIEGLKNISRSGDKITIGAAATFSEIIGNKLLQTEAPIICEAAKTVGSPQIRNQGTIGGNIVNASPAADSIPALLVLGARAALESRRGTRHIPIAEFVSGKRQTVLAKDELLTAVEVGIVGKCGYAFQKIGRRNSLAIARLNGACVLSIGAGVISSIKLAVGAAASHPLELVEVEQFLTGKQASESVLREAGDMAAQKVTEETGIRESSAYKLPVLRDFISDIICAAIRAEG